MFDDFEIRNMMSEAISLARKAQYLTAPNPCVGAVLVKDGAIIGRGFHKGAGLPHAEPEAINDAKKHGFDTVGATLFVTLEPCNHYGRTPPCSQAILNAGIKQVFIGARDPNPVVKGGGMEFLQSSGVQVIAGIVAQECQDLIADFKIWQCHHRPYVTVKLATTLDGKIAARTGKTEAISGTESHTVVHQMRSHVQAVMVGGNTLRRDNPQLTCRAPEFTGKQPLAVVVMRNFDDINETCLLVQSRPQETLFLTTIDAAQSAAAKRLTALGCTVWGVASITEGLNRLYTEHNCYYILCEGGGKLSASLMQEGLIDELALFVAPVVMGDDNAVSMMSGLTVQQIQDAYKWRYVETSQSGKDLYLRLKRE